jgi:dephospho-CoA kinase
MSLFFITGVAGSGKSEVTLGLRARGYEAYDTDDDALARWQHTKTGYIHPKSSVKSEQRTEKFIRNHRWNVPRELLENIASRAKDKPVFICGVANNIDDIRDLFSMVFALVVDEDTLRFRLANRSNNDWGKQPHELAQTLALQGAAEETYKKLGYRILDANQPIDKIIDSIVSNI